MQGDLLIMPYTPRVNLEETKKTLQSLLAMKQMFYKNDISLPTKHSLW